MSKYTLFWFRRDLRLHDNAGFYRALRNHSNVLPIFIFDRNILDKLDDKKDRRVEFIHQVITDLNTQLKAFGSGLLVKYGTPETVFPELLSTYDIEAVYTNHDFESYAIERDNMVHEYLQSEGVEFRTFKDHVIFEKNEVLSGSKTPYTVFTPYSRKWKETLNDFYVKSYPTEKYFSHLSKINLPEPPSLESMGFAPVGMSFPVKEVKDLLVKNYAEKRDFPAILGTSRLSVHLRFGTVSIRELVKKAQNLSETWLNELIWRDFYFNIVYHFPHICQGEAFRREYDQIEWRNNEQEFEAWCKGQTGYPIVDAGMRELNATGFMHNRVRMIVASFLTKHLLIDWRWGEAYFAKKLLDFDFAANNGGWQWASGSGCDAAPYFRVFNPTLQTQKFDKQLEYTKRWVPELNSLSYPQPIVNHEMARKRVLEVYQKALKK
ncbi:deoxyribodipyrimidine photo-lyase [Flectobacillus sp. BAB-3569]|uniref:cryptochrome/photolyase family protein n=1 Tax=Flectobacillus sp. BAB-3569 TaxID=1509483 RepID=UPI000BA2E900|nr:deoxyribodipyrimidine photo-lyase [Flectobacillus sp. BAB-3569]PAC27961.1 deoxyribodipyrimidine photolyase [Flectobacillus sp. BAB-3569]